MSSHPLLASANAAQPLSGTPEVQAALAAHQQAVALGARALIEAAGMELFGSFHLGGQEFALPAACIREVVRVPARITPIPLSPGYLEGIFTLRGAAIPMVNLARIFDPAAPGVSSEQRIAIIDHEDVQVGLVFDTTGEVLRVAPESRSSLRYEGRQAVISGAITLNEGARLLQVLDPDALIRIDNVPQVRSLANASRNAERQRFLRQAQGHKCIAFRVAGMHFALAMEAVQEIIRVPALHDSVMLGKLCKGWINLRGAPVGVVDFAALLDCGSGIAGDDQRVLIVRVGDDRLGLLVDSVDDIRPYFDSDVLPIPMLGTRRAAMFRGCLPDPERHDALFLAHGDIFSDAEVAEICAGHRRLYQDQVASRAGASASASKRQVYLAFALDTGWATDIKQVREIVPFSDAVTRPPGMPDCVHGMMQLRQQMVCVIDLRRLYGMAPLPADHDNAERRILVLEHGDERYGIIVDRVDTILSLPDSQRRPSPQLLKLNGPDDMRRDAGEVIEVPAKEGAAGNAVLTLFDKGRFIETLRAQLQA